MASIQDIFNIGNYATREAQRLAVEQQAEELASFIKGLAIRKSQAFNEVLNFENVSYDVVVTLSSLLLQINLYCRKTRSTLLLKQLCITELVDAVRAYYTGDYLTTAKYASFIQELFSCFTK